MTVVSHINRQGGLSLRRLFILAERLLRWAQLNLRSLRSMHILGKLNQGADMLSRNNVHSDKWTLHPQTVHEIWGIFSWPEVDLFASEDNTHCQTHFRRTGMRLPMIGPTSSFMLFPEWVLRTLQCNAAARLSRFSRSNLRSLGDCPHYIGICPTHSGGLSSHRLCSSAATIGLFVTKGHAVTLRY